MTSPDVKRIRAVQMIRQAKDVEVANAIVVAMTKVKKEATARVTAAEEAYKTKFDNLTYENQKLKVALSTKDAELLTMAEYIATQDAVVAALRETGGPRRKYRSSKETELAKQVQDLEEKVQGLTKTCDLYKDTVNEN